MGFYVHEDDWGLIDLVPAENLRRGREATAEGRAFSDAHRAPGGFAWTDVYVAPAMPISFRNRGVTLAALRALLPEMSLENRVASGYSSTTWAVKNAFALEEPVEPRAPRGSLYGTLDGEIIVNLFAKRFEEDQAPLLRRLGHAYRLVMIDWSFGDAIDLCDDAALESYFSYFRDEGEGA